MSEVQSTEAKQRILDSAASLFSQKGFASTSVRDIAQLAHVNVSSINYYFDSKENLLFTLLAKALHCLDDQMNAIDFDKVKDFSDLVDKMYLTLKQNHDMTLNIMRMVMSQESKEIKKYGLDQTIFIRPGEKILEKYFKFHFQKTLKKEDQEWIIHGMCSMLYHSIKYTCSPFAKTQEPQGMFDEKKIRKYLKRSAMLYYQEISSSHL